MPQLPTGLVMFSTPWCGYCRNLKKALARENIAYTEINIEAEPQWVEFVESVNNGNQIVPTVSFPDGSTATNPTVADILARLG